MTQHGAGDILGVVFFSRLLIQIFLDISDLFIKLVILDRLILIRLILLRLFRLLLGWLAEFLNRLVCFNILQVLVLDQVVPLLLLLSSTIVLDLLLVGVLHLTIWIRTLIDQSFCFCEPLYFFIEVLPFHLQLSLLDL